MAFIEPLDLWNILVNNLAGSVEIFVGIAFIFIVGLAAYFRMTNFTTLILMGLFFLMLAPFIGTVYALLVILILGGAIGITLRWIIQR